MLRSALATVVCTGLLAVASEAIGCPPSPPSYWAPTAIATDPSRPAARDAGVAPDAELPAGDHVIRVDVKDSEGRAATTSFTLKVSP